MISKANVTSHLDKEKIRALIPHAGTMLMLDRVDEWSADSIVCSSRTHLDTENPLRCNGRLSPLAGVEYAAQAVAIHGALTAVREEGAARRGYLAVATDVEWVVERLDDGQESMTVRATRLAALAIATEYAFALEFGNRQVVTGRLTIALEPGAG